MLLRILLRSTPGRDSYLMFSRTSRLGTWCLFLAGFYLFGIASGIGYHTWESARLYHPANSVEYRHGFDDGHGTSLNKRPHQAKVRTLCDFYLRSWISINHLDPLEGYQDSLVDYLDGCIDGMESSK